MAERGKGAVAPNPLVGAVVVREGKIIGEGWHRKYGGPHAEIDALNKAGESRGATLYVNLEPCSHQGKTPPCTDKIIKAGINRVVCSMVDPNPKIAGRGIVQLRQAGIEVEVGVMEEEARLLNEAFFKYIQGQKPFVSLKLALSLDGKIAAEDGSSNWITGPEAREEVHRLREKHQGIMVGSGTVLADDPRLNCRLDESSYQPLKIVIDRGNRISGERKIWEQGETWVFSSGKKFQLKPPHRLFQVKKNEAPEEILYRLGKEKISSILLEGGGELAGDFISRGLVDKFFLFFAPKILGGKGRGFTDKINPVNISEALKLKLFSHRRFGEDIMGVYYPEEGENVHRDN